MPVNEDHSSRLSEPVKDFRLLIGEIVDPLATEQAVLCIP